jgi:hypothetical protein
LFWRCQWANNTSAVTSACQVAYAKGPCDRNTHNYPAAGAAKRLLVSPPLTHVGSTSTHSTVPPAGMLRWFMLHSHDACVALHTAALQQPLGGQGTWQHLIGTRAQHNAAVDADTHTVGPFLLGLPGTRRQCDMASGCKLTKAQRLEHIGTDIKQQPPMSTIVSNRRLGCDKARLAASNSTQQLPAVASTRTCRRQCKGIAGPAAAGGHVTPTAKNMHVLCQGMR